MNLIDLKEKIDKIGLRNGSIFTLSDAKLRLWNQDTYDCVDVYDLSHYKIKHVDYDDDFLYLLDLYHLIMIDRDTLKEVYQFQFGFDISSDLLYVLNDKQYIYISIRNGKLVAVSKEDYTKHHVVQDKGESVWMMTQDQDYMYAGSVDKNISKWRKSDLTKVQTFIGHRRNVQGLCIDDDFLFSSSSDLSFAVWNKETGELIYRKTSVHKKAIKEIHTSPKYIVTGSWFGQRLKIWSKENYELVKEIIKTGHICINNHDLIYTNRKEEGLNILDLNTLDT